MDITFDQATRLAKLEIAQRAQSDLFFLCKHILGEDGELNLINEATHKELCDYTASSLPSGTARMPIIEPDLTEKHSTADQYDPRKNFTLILMPRGSFKSSIITIGFSLQYILNDPNARILIDSETFSKAKAFLAEIRGHLESNHKFREIYHTLYGSYPNDRKRDDLWSTEQLNISARTRPRKEPTFSCSGVDVTKTGMHYDLILMDDLHSEKNVTTKEQIDQVKQHYKLGLSLLDPGSPLIVIGTRWDYNDLYQHILDYERERFNIITRSAYNPDGSLFFPQRLDEKFLKETKESQGSYIFSCQYKNQPVDNESATFKRSYFIHKPWEDVKDRPINWYMSVDPSYEGPYSDYAAFVIGGMDYLTDLYVRYVKRLKMTYAEIINTMFELNNQFHPKRITLETLASAKSIEYELNNEQKRRGTWLPVETIKKRDRSKEDRIKTLAPKYEFGHVVHIKECQQLDDLEYELLHFPKGTHDDIIDALADILTVASPPSSIADSQRRERKKHQFAAFDKPRSPITGV